MHEDAQLIERLQKKLNTYFVFNLHTTEWTNAPLLTMLCISTILRKMVFI